MAQASGITPTRAASRDRLAPLAAASAGFAFVVLQVWAFVIAGTFEYPLDDVYIHLAMAEGIAEGTYGVNAGEPASAASSILYPLLLLPFPGSEVQRMLPLVWNFVGVIGCGWLWGRVLVVGSISGVTGTLMAIVGPIALNMPGVGFTGMEHSLHSFVSLAVLLGLWRFLTRGDIAAWFILAVIASPLLRLEGLAMSLGAVAILMLRERWRAGLVLGLAVILPVAAFATFLTSLGLDPLPSSVLAKMDMVAHGSSGIERLAETLHDNLTTIPGLVLAALVLTAFALPLAVRSLRAPAPALLLLVVGCAGLVHLLLAQVGMLDRYEHYIVVILVAGIVLTAPYMPHGREDVIRRITAVAIAAAAVGYVPNLLAVNIWNPRAVYLQQVQMARFVDDFAKVPVALNDLGRVAWRNDLYVLDLWGLASAEARRIRTAGNPAPGWAGPLVQAHDVPLAMIYDDYLGKATGPDWVRIARLTMDRPRGALGGWEVTFYATSPKPAAELRTALVEFIPTLPEGANLVMEEGG